MARRIAGLLAGAMLLSACAVLTPVSKSAPNSAQDAGDADALHLGHRLMAAGDHALAERAYSRAATDRGMSADVLAGLGSAHLAMGRLGTAERLLRRATETGEATPQMWNNLGVVLTERGAFLEASQVLRRAYALDNGASDTIRDNLRLALAKTENPGYTQPEEKN